MQFKWTLVCLAVPQQSKPSSLGSSRADVGCCADVHPGQTGTMRDRTVQREARRWCGTSSWYSRRWRGRWTSQGQPQGDPSPVPLLPPGAETQDFQIDGWVKVVTAFGPEICKRLVGTKGPYLASVDAVLDEAIARVIIVPHAVSLLCCSCSPSCPVRQCGALATRSAVRTRK